MNKKKSPSTSWLSPLKKGNISSFFKGGSFAIAKQVGLFIFLLTISTIYNRTSTTVNAQIFDSTSYHIDFGNFNMTSGSKRSANYKLTDTVGQNAPGQFNSNGYTVKAGFQYIYEQNLPFSFKISNLDLNFGSLTPEIGSTITNALTINSPLSFGYEILAIANHPLTTVGDNTTIPDTKCDTNVCSDSIDGPWVRSSTYGFGFNASGIGTSSYFTDLTYFRRFADDSLNETPKTIISENIKAVDHSALITYKINISSIQPVGTYQNSINFIAIPKY